jgi:hypothetical protein
MRVGNEGIFPITLNLGIRRRWVDTSVPLPLYPAERANFTFRILGGFSARGNNFPCPVALGWTLYRLYNATFAGNRNSWIYKVVSVNKPMTLNQCLPYSLLQNTESVENSCVWFVFLCLFLNLDDRRFVKVTELWIQISVSWIPWRRWNHSIRPLDVLKMFY